MMNRIAIATLAAALSGTALAAPETFVIDNTHTFPSFSYSHFGYTTQQSRFNKTSGKVVLDKSARTGSVDVVIDTTSVDSGYSVFNEHLQGADFLDTAKFPTATFKSTSVTFDGDKPATITGNLTLKVTGYQLMPHPMLKNDAIGANATTTVKRTAFNMGKYAPYVGDDVTISIAIEAIKE